VLEVFAHTNLLHQLVFVPVHACTQKANNFLSVK
jgi:hypothetical protein